ncbi:hypothetical protein PROFUN_14784 [Planoprotostelium fungivorum]|uniref:HNH nuclease domain-containing protein n=1 Tax=Planoprotostelium fungivorum TaxID=1890364 RepID=A0A2P6MYH8_9EUKA|nr:hypothetical protein PROFUN_14784 [Planoprotostelium fungivorum]
MLLSHLDKVLLLECSTLVSKSFLPGLGCFSNFLFPRYRKKISYITQRPCHTGHNSSYPRDLVPIPVATSNILKEMTDPNLPTMRTRINGLALTLAEKTWAQKELDAHPDLASTWTPETDVNLTAFIKQSATQSAPPGEASMGLYGPQALAQLPAAKSVLGGISEEKFEELMRISKAAYEEATQSRRERLQKSVSGKQRNNLSQKDWKNKLIQYYQRADLNNSGNITCMMLNQSFPGNKVIAAHLWDRSTNGLDLPHDFGLPIDSIDSERNGILVAKGIEDAWTYDRVAFIYNSLATPPVYFMVVLDPTLLEELVEPSPNIKFKDMDGQPLHMPLGVEPPFRRLMNFKSRNAVNDALHLWPEYWTDPSRRNCLNFDDFWELSDKASGVKIYPSSLFSSSHSESSSASKKQRTA